MSQTSHRIVGSPSLNPIYFLGAPTICIVDAIMVPIRLCVYGIKLPASFSSCLRLAVRHRFAEPDVNKDMGADNLRERKCAAIIMVLFGGLHSQVGVIPLLGINWILCCRVFGATFLFSLAVVETLVICSQKVDLDYTPLVDEADADDYYQALQDAEKIAENVEDAIVMFANAIHAWLMIYVIVDLWPEQPQKFPRRVDSLSKFIRLILEIGIRMGTVEKFHLLFPCALNSIKSRYVKASDMSRA
jgi:hypothetical protein